MSTRNPTLFSLSNEKEDETFFGRAEENNLNSEDETFFGRAAENDLNRVCFVSIFKI